MNLRRSMFFIITIIFLAFALVSYRENNIFESISCLGLSLFFINLALNFEIYDLGGRPNLKNFFDKSGIYRPKIYNWIFLGLGWVGLLTSVLILLFK